MLGILVLYNSFTHIYSLFAREPNCLVSRFLNVLPYYSWLFQLPLSMIVSHQLAELMDSLEEWSREKNENDTWIYIWGSGIFTSK
jgi:hypothetical protein